MSLSKNNFFKMLSSSCFSSSLSKYHSLNCLNQDLEALLFFFFSYIKREIEWQLSITVAMASRAAFLKVRGCKEQPILGNLSQLCSQYMNEIYYISWFFTQKEYNIQLTQKNQMMNYLTVMPNFYYSGPQRTTPYTPTTPAKETQNFPKVLLLTSISQALKISLKNYQQQLLNTPNTIQQRPIQTLVAEEKLKSSENVIEIIISEDDDEGNIKAKLHSQTSRNDSKPCLSPEKTSHPTLQLPTDDSNLCDSKESPEKKDGEAKKKNRKNRSQPQADSFQVNVPEIDLIDTAYLPETDCSYESLAKKRQQLMGRRVTDCNEFFKAKKQRREIRMLGN